MGKSGKVQDILAKNKNFQDFIDTRRRELQSTMDSHQQELENGITAFYSKTCEQYTCLAEGEKWDEHLASEVVLTDWKQRITELVDAAFQQASRNVQDRTEIEKTENGSVYLDGSASAQEAWKKISAYQEMVTVKAYLSVLDALGLFAPQENPQDAGGYSGWQLAPGLMLHMIFFCEQKQEATLHEDALVTTFLRFRLTYSEELAEQAIYLNSITELMKYISDLEANANACQQEMMKKLMEMAPNNQAEVARLQARSSAMQAIVNEAKGKAKVMMDGARR